MFRFAWAIALSLALPWAAATAAAPTKPATLLAADHPLIVALFSQAPPELRAVLRDGSDGKWDQHSLTRSALLAGGVRSTTELTRLEAKLNRHVQRLRTDKALPASATETARFVFEYLHREILTGEYDLNATGIQITLDDGRYNCVSSTLLFHILAESCGLTVQGVETPRHVYSRVISGGLSLDVETTCPTWFRLPAEQRIPGLPGSPREAGSAEIAPRRVVNNVQLVAAVFYNRGIEQLKRDEFAAAAESNLAASLLDAPRTEARDNLFATLNNWSLSLAKQRRYDEALALLSGGRTLDPEHRPFAVNELYVRRLKAETRQ